MFPRWRTPERPRGRCTTFPGAHGVRSAMAAATQPGAGSACYSLGRWPGSCIPYCFVPSSRGWDGIIRPAPAGRHPSPSRPAGRTRPSGPGPLYTVHRDHGGHGGHGDATGDARPTATSALLRAARGRAARAGPGGVDCAAAADSFVTVTPPSRVRTCGGRAARARARRGRDRPTLLLMGGTAHHPRQLFLALRGTTGVPGQQARASTG